MTTEDPFWTVLRAEAREREQQRTAARERAEARISATAEGDPRKLTREQAAIATLANDGQWLLQLAEAIYQLLMYGPDREDAEDRAVELMGEFDRQAESWQEGYSAACQLGLAPMLGGETTIEDRDV